MITVRLLHRLSKDHFEIAPGTVIGLPADLAHQAFSRGIAEPAAPMTAVVQPQETRRRGRPLMRAGKLLALSPPSELKQSALPGLAWDVFAEPLLPALIALENCQCVQRVGLAGDHLKVLTLPEKPVSDQASELIIRSALVTAGITSINIELVEPTLEDVFLALSDPNIIA